MSKKQHKEAQGPRQVVRRVIAYLSVLIISSLVLRVVLIFLFGLGAGLDNFVIAAIYIIGGMFALPFALILGDYDYMSISPYHSSPGFFAIDLPAIIAIIAYPLLILLATRFLSSTDSSGESR